MDLKEQRVMVGQRLRSVLGGDVEFMLKKILDTHFLESWKPSRTCIRVSRNGDVYELVVETRWTDAQQSEMVTMCALRTEWRELTGEEPPWHEDFRGRSN